MHTVSTYSAGHFSRTVTITVGRIEMIHNDTSMFAVGSSRINSMFMLCHTKLITRWNSIWCKRGKWRRPEAVEFVRAVSHWVACCSWYMKTWDWVLGHVSALFPFSPIVLVCLLHTSYITTEVITQVRKNEWMSDEKIHIYDCI